MRCKKCGKDSKVLCICGYCPKCNNTNKIINEHLKELIKFYKGIKK